MSTQIHVCVVLKYVNCRLGLPDMYGQYNTMGSLRSFYVQKNYSQRTEDSVKKIVKSCYPEVTLRH